MVFTPENILIDQNETPSSDVILPIYKVMILFFGHLTDF